MHSINSFTTNQRPQLLSPNDLDEDIEEVFSEGFAEQASSAITPYNFNGLPRSDEYLFRNRNSGRAFHRAVYIFARADPRIEHIMRTMLQTHVSLFEEALRDISTFNAGSYLEPFAISPPPEHSWVDLTTLPTDSAAPPSDVDYLVEQKPFWSTARIVALVAACVITAVGIALISASVASFAGIAVPLIALTEAIKWATLGIGIVTTLAGAAGIAASVLIRPEEQQEPELL